MGPGVYEAPLRRSAVMVALLRTQARSEPRRGARAVEGRSREHLKAEVWWQAGGAAGRVEERGRDGAGDGER